MKKNSSNSGTHSGKDGSANNRMMQLGKRGHDAARNNNI